MSPTSCVSVAWSNETCSRTARSVERIGDWAVVGRIDVVAGAGVRAVEHGARGSGTAVSVQNEFLVDVGARRRWPQLVHRNLEAPYTTAIVGADLYI